MQASKQSKQEKLARKLQPNQSIRSDQKKLSAQRHRPPLAPLPEPEAVEIEWFDCSKNSDSKNEDCLKMLLELINSPSPETRSNKRGLKTPQQDASIQESSAFDQTASGSTSTIDQSKRVIKLIEKSSSNYLKYKGNPNFLLGLNSTLKYLENLRLILIQLVGLVRDRRHDASNEQAGTLADPGCVGSKNAGLRDPPVLEPIENTLSEMTRDLQNIRFIVVFKHQQHLSVINLLATFVHEINLAFAELNSRNQSTTQQAIKLVAFPLSLNPPLLTTFNVRRLSCFAILVRLPFY
ncbi:hypothetical protein PCANC_28389 [Puccinia coronata f. sp. avenae]|uniref:Uncharacterized protein n=1 Tax=Puccinia coronata f. sp. avenae TaxID=200324 RepID=A0A2N5RTW1_9BASI|nr:hypothetical protein PCANC_28389 [Puccinia coronata f. sp. avenae]